jgi:hypothetical protein
MTPSFFFNGDWLLRAQLRCLSEQLDKDFDVCLIDSHYSKRASLVPQYAEHYRLNIVHIPYMPNIRVAKRLDCAIFNAPYMYSESPRIVRLSCWRFVRPDFTKICSESKSNVDFYFHNCEPSRPEDAHPDTAHALPIWDMTSDVVNWGSVPRCGSPGAAWTHHSETDAKAELMPLNCYGNYMIFRNTWLQLNGCNEVFTNNEHWEDQDFCARARNLGVQCARSSNKMYRLHHYYGGHSGRSNVPTDHEFKKPCAACDAAHHAQPPNRYDTKNRAQRGEVELFEHHKIWVCKTCLLASADWSQEVSEATTNVARRGIIKATIIPKYKLGRNLSILAEDMKGKSLSEKVEIFNKSWDDARYYVP